MRTQSIVVLVMSLVLVAAAPSSQARGAIVTYDLGFEYSGATPPAGAGPWLRATFDDGGSPGAVTLTLTALNLTGGEFVNDWMFNLDPRTRRSARRKPGRRIHRRSAAASGI